MNWISCAFWVRLERKKKRQAKNKMKWYIVEKLFSGRLEVQPRQGEIFFPGRFIDIPESFERVEPRDGLCRKHEFYLPRVQKRQISDSQPRPVDTKAVCACEIVLRATNQMVAANRGGGRWLKGRKLEIQRVIHECEGKASCLCRHPVTRRPTPLSVFVRPKSQRQGKCRKKCTYDLRGVGESGLGSFPPITRLPRAQRHLRWVVDISRHVHKKHGVFSLLTKKAQITREKEERGKPFTLHRLCGEFEDPQGGGRAACCGAAARVSGVGERPWVPPVGSVRGFTTGGGGRRPNRQSTPAGKPESESRKAGGPKIKSRCRELDQPMMELQ